MTSPLACSRHVLVAVVAVAFVLLLPQVVHACPMCFTGGNSNSKAFVWGSLFLMFVPTAALGTLGYLAYRRIKAIDAAYEPQPPEPAGPSVEPERPSGEQPVART